MQCEAPEDRQSVGHTVANVQLIAGQHLRATTEHIKRHLKRIKRIKPNLT